MTRINVIDGDIAQIESDGLISAINSSGLWFGGVDGVINRAAGKVFHVQAAESGALQDGNAIFARGNSQIRCKFGNVIFVVDDLERDLRHIVAAGLNEAEKQGLARVTMPTLRTGVMAGVYEPTVGIALTQMVMAIKEFVGSNPQHVEEITVVTFRDEGNRDYLTNAFGLTKAR